MKKVIRASDEAKLARGTVMAADSGQEAYDEAVDGLKADFDFVLDGLEKMVRDGNGKDALQFALEFSSTVGEMVNKVASGVTE